MALAALEKRQMNGVFVGLQIVGVADSVNRTDVGTDVGTPVTSRLRIRRLLPPRPIWCASSPFVRTFRTRFRPLRVGTVPIA